MEAQMIVEIDEVGKEIVFDAVEFRDDLLGRKIKNYLKKMRRGDSITICSLYEGDK